MSSVSTGTWKLMFLETLCNMQIGHFRFIWGSSASNTLQRLTCSYPDLCCRLLATGGISSIFILAPQFCFSGPETQTESWFLLRSKQKTFNTQLILAPSQLSEHRIIVLILLKDSLTVMLRTIKQEKKKLIYIKKQKTSQPSLVFPFYFPRVKLDSCFQAR